MKPCALVSSASAEDAGKDPLKSANGVLPYMFSCWQSPYRGSRPFNLDRPLPSIQMWMWVRSQTLPEGQRGRLDVCRKDARCIVNVPKLIDQGYLDWKH